MFLAPLLASPTGRELIHGTALHAQGLARLTVGNAGNAMRGGTAKAVDLSHKTQQAAGGLASKTQQSAGSLFSGTQHLAANLSTKAQQAAGSLRFGKKQEANGVQADDSPPQQEDVTGPDTQAHLADANAAVDGGGDRKDEVTSTNAKTYIVDANGGRDEKSHITSNYGQPQVAVVNGGNPLDARQVHTYQHLVKGDLE